MFLEYDELHSYACLVYRSPSLANPKAMRGKTLTSRIVSVTRFTASSHRLTLQTTLAAFGKSNANAGPCSSVERPQPAFAGVLADVIITVVQQLLGIEVDAKIRSAGCTRRCFVVYLSTKLRRTHTSEAFGVLG